MKYHNSEMMTKKGIKVNTHILVVCVPHRNTTTTKKKAQNDNTNFNLLTSLLGPIMAQDSLELLKWGPFLSPSTHHLSANHKNPTTILVPKHKTLVI
jgi:hypothetical protein